MSRGAPGRRPWQTPIACSATKCRRGAPPPCAAQHHRCHSCHSTPSQPNHTSKPVGCAARKSHTQELKQQHAQQLVVGSHTLLGRPRWPHPMVLDNRQNTTRHPYHTHQQLSQQASRCGPRSPPDGPLLSPAGMPCMCTCTAEGEEGSSSSPASCKRGTHPCWLHAVASPYV